MHTLPVAAIQLESMLRTTLNLLAAPGAWLAETLPGMLVPGALALAAALLATLLHRSIP